MNLRDTPGERLLAWERGETSGPWYVSLFPTNRCNLKCSICWQRRLHLDYSNELSDERLLRLVDECAELGAKEWIIVGGGEPMIRGELVIEMCERICRQGMNGRIQSNGLHFKEEHFERLINIGWSEVVFSLDGPTAEINDHIRSRGSFIHATANMRKLNELRKKYNTEFPKTFLTSVVTSTNYDKFEGLVELAHELGCEGLRGGQLTPEGDLSRDFELTPQQLAAFPEHIKRAGRRAEKLGLDHGLYELLSDQSGTTETCSMPQAPEGAEGIARAACLEPWLGIQVQPDGYVGPCCVFWDTEADSIKDMSLQEVWLGPYLSKVRSDFLEGRYQSYCASCHSWFRVHDAFFREGLALARSKEVWDKSSWIERMQIFVKKSWSSLRRNGLLVAVKRGFRWFQIYCRR